MNATEGKKVLEIVGVMVSAMTKQNWGDVYAAEKDLRALAKSEPLVRDAPDIRYLRILKSNLCEGWQDADCIGDPPQYRPLCSARCPAMIDGLCCLMGVENGE